MKNINVVGGGGFGEILGKRIIEILNYYVKIVEKVLTK